MSVYEEFTGKTVEEALRSARESFGVELNDLDFEILTPGSRGVLGMGAEPARIVAAPRSALGGTAPKREAAATTPLPAPPPREDRGPVRDDRGPRDDRGRGRDGWRDRGPRRDDRPRDDRPPRPDAAPPRPDAAPPREARPARDDRPRDDRPRDDRPRDDRPARTDGPAREPRQPRDDRPRDDRPREPRPRDGGRTGRPDRGPRGDRPARTTDLSAREAEEVAAAAARGPVADRPDVDSAEASPEALAAGREILETLMGHLGYDVTVQVIEGDTSRINVTGEGEEKEALGALIGRRGERLSALQHLVNLMLSRRMGEWTRVLVDVEDYRGRRERQLHDLAERAASRVAETGKMIQLEPMPALDRRWVHLALRNHPAVMTQSIGEEPDRRIVVLPKDG